MEVSPTTLPRRHIAIFEPWGLGDIVIALLAAKAVHAAGNTVSLLCDGRWAGWLNTFPFVSRVIPVNIPWTSKDRKYAPSRYRISDFVRLRGELAAETPTTVCELRGDIRNVLLLKALRVGEVVSLRGETISNRYDRPGALLRRMGIPEARAGRAARDENRGRGKVACFFGAEWPNRRVPFAKAARVVEGLLEAGHSVSVILSPGEESAAWSRVGTGHESSLSLIRRALPEVCAALAGHDTIVSTDSGWMHVGFFYGLSVIGLFAFSNAEEWAPPGAKVLFAPKPGAAEERYARAGEGLQPLAELSEKMVVDAVDQSGKAARR